MIRVCLVAVASVVLLTVPLRSDAQTCCCGTVVNGTCPSCAYKDPGGCSCQTVSENCHCSPQQNKVTCESGNFDFSIQPSGVLQQAENPELCSTVWKCLAQGALLTCETYPNCGAGACTWQEHSASTATTYSGAGACP